MKVAELSRKTGISEVSLSRLYHGADRIRFDTLNKICIALQCTPCDLLEFVPDEPSSHQETTSEDLTKQK